MANLSVTAASVVPSTGATFDTTSPVAGETVTRGQPVYKKASDGLWYKAGAAVASPNNHCDGICLSDAAVNQQIIVQRTGKITIGATVVAGTPYYLSATAGSIATLFGDLVSTNTVVLIGIATSTTVIDMGNNGIYNSGAVI